MVLTFLSENFKKKIAKDPEMLGNFLEEQVQKNNRPDFIKDDPIQIPHRFTKRQDIEIMAFWAATLAWGQRKSIIKSANKLAELMDNAPYDFIKHHQETDRKRFVNFVHRTFQPTDALYFLAYLQQFYQKNDSLETAFLPDDAQNWSVKMMLTHFHRQFFALDYAPERTRKHVATPERGSACKRLCMFLRWVVRRDTEGVDFGLWQRITPANLMMPLDVHVERVARALGLLTRLRPDWEAVEELTANLRKFDPLDPVKYDFALFGLGIEQKTPFD